METFKQNLHQLSLKLDLSPRKSKLNLPQWGDKLILWLTSHSILSLLNENRMAQAKVSSLSNRLIEAEQKIHLLEQSQTHLQAELATAATHLKGATMAHKDAERKLDALKCSTLFTETSVQDLAELYESYASEHNLIGRKYGIFHTGYSTEKLVRLAKKQITAHRCARKLRPSDAGRIVWHTIYQLKWHNQTNE